MRKRILLAAAVSGAMVFALSACVPSAQESDSTTDAGEGEKPIATMVANEETLPDVYNLMAEQAEEWAPEVRTLDDGTQVQRTPDSGPDVFFWGADSSYNTLYLDADNRGCESCHTDGLADLVDNHLSYMHWKLSNGLGTVVNVKDCIECHDNPEAHGQDAYDGAFAHLIHGIHNRDSFKGDCMSCHATQPDGQMPMWDIAKYDIMTGIEQVENVQGDFSFNQDHLQGDNIVFTYPWPGGPEDYESGPEKVFNDCSYDEWEINIAGEVDNPFTITVQELIDQAPHETFVSAMQCYENNPTGEFEAQVEVTGVPLSWIIEKAGVHEGVNAYTPASSDGSDPQPMWTAEDPQGAWLVYEVNGRPLNHLEGYPIRMWLPDHKASLSRRGISDITFETLPQDEIDNLDRYANEKEISGPLKPNVAVCNIHEGQVIKVGEPFKFEGFAEGLNYNIGAMEFSMDGGETWTRYETPDTDVKRWVWWNFDFTPEEPGAYILMVRGITAAGGVSPVPDQVMVVAKDEA